LTDLDLNSDLGEGFGAWHLTDDDALLDVVTSANVACGFHAGDLVAAGVAAGALDVSDPEATAVLCYASMHAFDLRGHGGPDDTRLIRAAQQLVRRAAGLP